MTTHRNCGFKVSKVLSLILAIIISSTLSMAEETFPSRPINVVVGFAPGGSTDLGIRIVANQLSKELGVSIVVLNKPGGGGLVGSEFVRQSKPDGYTLFGASLGFVTTPTVDPKCPYTVEDFDPVCLHDTQSTLISVRSESPFKTIQEVIDFAKKHPGKLNYGHSGINGSGHFLAELLKLSAGVNITSIPFKGDSPAITATIGGHVDLGVMSTAISPLIKGGKLRGLVSGGKKRSPDLPEIPTMAEVGYPDVVVESWHGFLGPRGIPKPVMDKLSIAFEKAVNDPSVQKQIEQIGLFPAYMNASQFKDFLKEETEKFKTVALKAQMIIKY